VPIISVFLGITVRMFYQEHDPPHFHVEHPGRQATFDFAGRPVAGLIRSKTALRLIRRWAVLHRTALESNWLAMKQGKALERIPPLE
jgi:Domain of unknown function (DUF4160)